MNDTKYDPSFSWKSTAFGKLLWKSTEKGFNAPRSKPGIFNQVKAGACPERSCGCADQPQWKALSSAVSDNAASASTLSSIATSAREVREAVIDASGVSIQQVEALASLADDISRRVMQREKGANDAHADQLRIASVERLLR